MIRRTLVWVLILGALSGIAKSEVVTIRDDFGGNITAYVWRRAELASAEAVRIVGHCYSACTIFTTLANACVGPDARIGFHGPDVILPPIQRYLDWRVGRFYRGEVRQKYDAVWRHIRGKTELHVISGRALAALDPAIKICGKG